MTITLERVTVEMRPPSSTTWTTLSNDADTPGRLLPIDELIISWSTPSPRDHPDPVEASLTVLLDPGGAELDLLHYDTAVRVTAHTSTSSIPVFVGWLTEWTRLPHLVAGRHAYQLGLMDIIARAAATRIGDTPWPGQTASDRGRRLNVISPAGPLAGAMPTHLVVARDVDATPALDIVQACASPSQIVVPTIINQEPYLSIVGAPAARPGSRDVIPIPASLIEDTGRTISRTHVVTEIGITAAWDDLDSPTATITLTGKPTGYTTSRWTRETDVVLSSPTAATTITDWARAVIGESATVTPSLPGRPRIFLNADDDVPGLERLLHLRDRHRSILSIVDGPDDIDPTHFVTGGELTIRGLKPTLNVELMPGAAYGIRSIHWNEIDTALARTSPTFQDITTSINAFRYQDMASLSLVASTRLSTV